MPHKSKINSISLDIEYQALDLQVERGMHNSFVNERFGLLVARVALLRF